MVGILTRSCFCLLQQRSKGAAFAIRCQYSIYAKTGGFVGMGQDDGYTIRIVPREVERGMHRFHRY